MWVTEAYLASTASVTPVSKAFVSSSENGFSVSLNFAKVSEMPRPSITLFAFLLPAFANMITVFLAVEKVGFTEIL